MRGCKEKIYCRKVTMDKLDLRILRELQNDFPLSQRPYEIIARRLQVPPQQFWNRLQSLTDEGLIRRLGACLDSRKLGFRNTLAAVSVEPGLVSQAAEVINQFAEVTHSYLRKDYFNIWFTLTAPDNETIKRILERIRSALSLESRQVLNLPAKRLFKLDARFNL